MKNIREYIGKEVEIIIDRPLGSKHPKHDMTYDVNYGYVPNTTSADGEEIDAYLLGENKPVKKAIGRCIAVVHRTNDDDDKLIIVKDGFENLSDEEILKQINFQEKYFISEIIR